jgi:Ca-activated chloride channel family protein
MVAAVGAIVLLQANSQAEQSLISQPSQLIVPHQAINLSGINAIPAPRLNFDYSGVSGTVGLTQGAVLAQGTSRLFAELRLAADDLEGAAPRRPVALVVVLDISGSMQGDKIDEARRAVSQLVRGMRDDDQIAVILYNDSAYVLQPMARVGSIRESLIGRVSLIAAGGGTNIPQGLRLGTGALISASDEFVRRVVLVSDGLDHSGVPLDSVAGEVRGRANQGATLSSLGVGTDYDERFLSSVADAGRGNYEFLANSDQLASFLRRELEQASSTVVTNLVADLELPLGWRVSQVYGAELGPQLSGRHAVLIPVGAMYAGEQRRVLIALDVNGAEPGQQEAMGVRFHYNRPLVTATFDHQVGQLALRTVTDDREVLASRNIELHADAMTTVIDARQEQAVALWREGRADEAAALSVQNAQEMQVLNDRAFSQHRADRIGEYQQDSGNFQAQSAGSASGRAYGLRANQARRVRSRSW